MEALIGLLGLALIVFLIAGLIKPSITQRFVKSPSRMKVFGLFLLGFTILAFLSPAATAGSDGENATAAQGVAEPATVYTPEERDSIDRAAKAAAIAEREDQTLSAAALAQTYDNNEVRADGNFKGKTFYVEGRVTDIKKDMLGDIYVILEGAGFRDVQCFFDDPDTAARLDRGAKVTFRGECRGLMMNVLMYDCQLVENLSDLKAG